MQGLITWVLILNFVSQCLCLRWNAETEIASYNVMDYGAIGDGIADDSQAFLKAWQTTCAAQGTGNLVIPPNKVFLVQNVILNGPCKATSVTIRLQGKIVAPPKAAWAANKSYLIYVSGVYSLTIDGNGGLIDGVGSTWWTCTNCPQKPTAIHFHACNNLAVNYLHIINSPRAHIQIDSTVGATFSHVNIQAPVDSPNTDGFDIATSRNIVIKDSTVATGDDCVAINNGCTFINVTGVACGPGHGISVGSLGRYNSHERVEEVYVRNCSFIGTTNGARIKTSPGGSGFARKITFEQITLNRVKNPVIIDQEYVEANILDESSLAVSDVTYRGFQGTSSVDRVIDLDCSPAGCFDITLDHINIVSAVPGKQAYAFCKNAHGIAISTVPSVTCLLK